MRRRELESKLSDLGWRFLGHGGGHDIWARGEETIPVPRHTEINENLARSILRRAAGKR